MSEEIKIKKERKFLKALGKIGEVLIQELFFKVGSNLIRKIGGKKTLPSILFLLASLSLFAQFPNTGNKQRLGFQTTGDGLVWRGALSDTASIQPINNQSAWVILDTINLKFYTFDFTSNIWNLVGGALTMPFDSITFNTAKNGTVGVGEVEYNDTQGSLIQGLKGGNVTNVIGQQLHQRVNNRTGAPLTKGDVVYLAGSHGNRITVAKGLAVSDAFSANTFGVVAESIADNQSGFIITEGLITGLNTSALTEDSAVYLSPTVAGALTSTKPQAPQHSVYIGVCVKSSNGSGELFVKIRNGQELDELHDTRITNPVTGATLYYSGGLWRDTTAALLLSDTASMLTPYLRKADTASISNRINLKVNISDTLNMLVPYLRKADTTLMLSPYFRDADTSLLNLTSRFAAKQNTLNGTGFVKANGTTISYDNSSYLRTGLADSTYLKLTGGTLTGGLTGTTALFSGNVAIGFPFAYKPFEVLSNANDFVSVGVRELQKFQWSGIHFGYREADLNYRKSAIVFQRNEASVLDASGRLHILNVDEGQGSRNADLRDAKITIGNNGGVGINDTTPSFTLDVNGTLNATGATTLGSTLAVTGDITENGNNVLTSADTSAFARDNQISGTSGQVAYFNSSNSVISDAGLIYNATNKSLGINTTTTSGANLIIKNSQEPSRATIVTTQTFAADTTNWTRGAGWTFDGTQAVATAATGDLTYTPALTITSGNAYEITYTVTGYSAGILTARIGNSSFALPTHNATANIILLFPTSPTGGFRFTTSSFTGNIDNLSVVEISNTASILLAGQDDGTATLYSNLRMPNSTSLFFGDGGSANTGTSNTSYGINALKSNTTAINNVAFGSNALFSNTNGGANAAIGQNALRDNTTGANNLAIGESALRVNTTGSNNVGLGANSLARNLISTNNLGIGSFSLFLNRGSDNIGIGTSALRSNVTGSSNVGIGSGAMYNNVATDTLTGLNNIAIGNSAANNIRFGATGNVVIGSDVDLPTNNGSNQGVYQNVLFFTGATGQGVNIAAASKAGIKTNAPNRDLEVAGEVRITDLTTDTPTRLVGADADGDLGQVTLGSTLSLTGSSLGVTSNTFLPLTGGTLTGGLTGTTGSFGTIGGNIAWESGDFKIKPYTNYSSENFGIVFNSLSETETMDFYWFGYSEQPRRAFRFIDGSTNSEKMRIEPFTGNVGINQTVPSFTLDVNGTLGVTGATTLSAPLTVNSSAVFNEGSVDADFRVESDANANMIFVDASTDRVGIGTNTPTKTLDVNGELNVSSAGTFGGRLNTNWMERTYSNSTATSLTISVNTTWLKLVNNSTITLTLPNAATYPGKELHVKNAGTGAVNSLSSNIEPLNSTTIGTAILASGGGKWATLVSDGSNWVIMAGN